MSNLTLIIGNKDRSTWSLSPWILMRQKQVNFIEKNIKLATATTNQELNKYNSNFKVPVLIDISLTIHDSLAIMEFISDKYLFSGGWPRDISTRAIARSISAEVHSSFVNVRRELPMNCCEQSSNLQLSEAAQNEIKRIKSIWRDCKNKFGSDQEWLFGGYSIADAMFAPIALQFAGYGIPLDGIEQKYVNSVLSQPNIQEWIKEAKLEKEAEVMDEDNI